MLHELATLIRYSLGQGIAGRSLRVFPDDTFIVSFPRSGNTWTRFLVANLLHPGRYVTFQNIERIIPDMHAQGERFMRRVPRPRIIKSHEYFDARFRRVIYIVRDPRDVLLSSYNFHRKQRQIPDDYPLQQYVTRFLSGDVWTSYASWSQNVCSWLATHSQVPAGGLFGNWANNVSSWLTAPIHSCDLLLLRYETMVAEPARELARIADFLRIEATPDLLSQAVTRSSVLELRKLERTQARDWIMTKHTRQDIPFIGGAQAGGWRSNLPAEWVGQVETSWGPLMTALGYKLRSGNQLTETDVDRIDIGKRMSLG